MKRFFDSFLWIAIVILFIPSYMIIASWNSLPGEGLYGTKLALERLALGITSPSYAAQSSLQLAYTEKRFAESNSLFNDKHSVQGLSYLSDQVKATRDTINKAPNKKTQQDLAALYVQRLTEVSAQLETQKNTLTSSSPSKTVAVVPPKLRTQPSPVGQVQQTNPISTNQQTVPPQPVIARSVQQTTTTKINTTTSSKTTTSTLFKQQSSASVSQPTPTQSVIAQVSTTTTDIEPENMMAALEISQTQETIRQTINELETVSQETTTTTTTRSNEKSHDENGKKSGDDGRENSRGDKGNNNRNNDNRNNNGNGNNNRSDNNNQGDH